MDSLFSALTRTVHISLYCCPVPLHFHVVPATVAPITQWSEIVCSLLTSVHVLSYQPSCNSCFHLATILKSVAAMMFRLWTTDDNRRDIITDSTDYLVTKLLVTFTCVLIEPRNLTQRYQHCRGICYFHTSYSQYEKVSRDRPRWPKGFR